MSSLKLLALPLIAMSLSAFAQNAPPASPQDRGYDASPAPAGEPRRLRFADADTDHDGRLSRTEAQAAPYVARHFDAIDADHDGYVTRAELRAARGRFQAAHVRRGGNGQNSGAGYNGAPAPDQGDEGMN